MDEAEVIERVALIAHDEPAEVAQPGEDPLNFPAAPIASERATILGLGTHPLAAMGRDHLDAPPRQRPIESIGIASAIPDQALRQFRDEARVKGGGDEGDLVRRS